VTSRIRARSFLRPAIGTAGPVLGFINEAQLRENNWVFDARTGVAFLLAFCDCHPDRSAMKMPIPTSRAFSGAEWRDPEGSFLLNAASRRSHEMPVVT
jgi:hypothetical protein